MASSSPSSSSSLLASLRGFPSQVKYIIGNEACERFSFYGMRSILVVFMTHTLLLADHQAKGVFHLFVSANYFLTLVGAVLADRLLGKYKTILYLSLIYCLGHFVLALFESKIGLYCGLSLIALGAGGIKPCVAAFMGDQFTEKNKSSLVKAFDIFYFSINFGGFFSALLIPLILPRYGSRLAFGIPGILMAIATYIFWIGRNRYVSTPPTKTSGEAGFFPIFLFALTNMSKRKTSEGFWDVARQRYSEADIEGAKAAASVFKVFITVAMFWALWDQQGSSWVLQAEKMNRSVFGTTIEAAQLQALNPILTLLMIPLFSVGIYPLVERMGFRLTPLRKMGAGMVCTGFSFAAVGIIQVLVDRGVQLSVLWQIVPYCILTASEIMVSITGLEFAYTQAPRTMKSTIMSFWYLAIALGNFLTAIVSEWNQFHGPMEFFFYGGLMFVVAAVFIVLAARYKVRDFVNA